MLTTKFLKKYGQDNKELQSYINGQVAKFMNANRLTETNLAELDTKIQKEKETLDKRAAVRAKRAQDATADVKSQIRSQVPSNISKRPSSAKPMSIR